MWWLLIPLGIAWAVMPFPLAVAIGRAFAEGHAAGPGEFEGLGQL
jgi:hypothetical protein